MIGSAFNIMIVYTQTCSFIIISLQVPPIPANDQPVYIPPPDRAVAEPGRMQDMHIDVAYQGIVDLHPQPLAVSNFRLSADWPLFDQ